MKNNKTSEAQIRDNAKWNKNNKEKTKYINGKSRAKTFINKESTLEDLKVFENYIKNRIKELEQQKTLTLNGMSVFCLKIN